MAVSDSKFTLLLIDVIRKSKHLYDINDEDYKDYKKRQATWEEIGVYLDQPCDVLKAKWKNLRDSYVKYQKFLKLGTGSKKYRKYKCWPWARHLRFLDGSLKARSNSKLTQKRKNDDRPIFIDCLQTKNERLLDRTDHLFLSYAETFKSFPKKTQAEIKMKLSEVFGKAELANIRSREIKCFP